MPAIGTEARVLLAAVKRRLGNSQAEAPQTQEPTWETRRGEVSGESRAPRRHGRVEGEAHPRSRHETSEQAGQEEGEGGAEAVHSVRGSLQTDEWQAAALLDLLSRQPLHQRAHRARWPPRPR